MLRRFNPLDARRLVENSRRVVRRSYFCPADADRSPALAKAHDIEPSMKFDWRRDVRFRKLRFSEPSGDLVNGMKMVVPRRVPIIESELGGLSVEAFPEFPDRNTGHESSQQLKQ